MKHFILLTSFSFLTHLFSPLFLKTKIISTFFLQFANFQYNFVFNFLWFNVFFKIFYCLEICCFLFLDFLRGQSFKERIYAKMVTLKNQNCISVKVDGSFGDGCRKKSFNMRGNTNYSFYLSIINVPERLSLFFGTVWRLSN